MTEERFVGYFKLVEACAAPGCPVCRCVEAESRSYLDALLYEQVTDPDTRRAIRASWGFCNWHTWMLLDIENSLFGAAIIYEDLVGLALRRTERLRQHRPRGGWVAQLMGRPRRHSVVDLYRRRAACPACASTAKTERHYLDTVVTFVDDGDLCAAYARSDGLCVPHLFAAAEDHGERPEMQTLVERTREKWATLSQDIGAFVRKHDYRNRDPYTAAETASYTRAFETLAGARHLFGNDVHVRTSARPLRTRTSATPGSAAAADGNAPSPRVVGERAS